MNKLCRLLLLLTLLACLLVPAGASAITGAQIAALRGERSYPQSLDLPDALSVAAQSSGAMLRNAETGYPRTDAGKISALADRYIDEIRDIGDAVDFLSVFTTDYVGALVHQANHIQSLYLLCENQLGESERAYAAQTIEDYSLIASQLYSEVEFLTTKLTYCYERMDVLVYLIQSGEYTPSQTDEYLAELAALCDEAKERLDDFTDKANLEKLLNDYFSAQLMLTAMENVIEQLHESTEQTVSDGAAALYAAENSGKLRAAGAQVTIVSKSEYVVTVAGPDGSPLEGADVEIRVLDGGGKLVRKLEPKKTNKYGYAIFCFSDMRPDTDGKASVDVWVRADGCRTQATGKVTAEGGGFTPVTLEEDDGSPYIVQITYNGEDILRKYNGIYISWMNEEQQTITFTVNTKVPCSASLYQPVEEKDDHVVVQFDVNPDQPGEAVRDSEHPTEYTCSFTKRFCNERNFLRKLTVYAGLRWTQEDHQTQQRSTITPFAVKRARVPNPIRRYDSKAFMNTAGFRLPKDWPVVGDVQFQIPFGWELLPITLFIDMNGTRYFGFSLKLEDWGYTGKSDSMEQRDAMDKALNKSNASALSKIGKGIANDYSLMKPGKVLGSFTGSCVPYLMFIERCADIDDDEEIDEGWHEYQGDMSIGGILSFSASMITATPIPLVYLTVDFGVGLNVAVTLGVKEDCYGLTGERRNLTISDSTGIMISPYLDVTAALMFGAPRYVYVGVRARAYATADFIILDGFKYISAKAYASASIEAVVLKFKYSWTFWQVNWSFSAPGVTQSRVLLASLEEAGGSYAASSNGDFPLDPDAPVGGDAYRTQTGQITPTSIIRMCDTENSNVRFLPISMAFSRRQGRSVSDMGLAMWIENKAIDGVQRYRLCYRATSLDDANDLAGLSPQIFTLDFGLGDGYDVVDFDVDSYCKDDSTAPVLSVLITAVPHGTPAEQAEQETELYFAQFTAQYGTAKNAFDGPTFPTVTFARKDNSARRITLADGSEAKRFILPRVRVLDGTGEIVLGALHPHESGSGTEYSVMMSHISAPYLLTAYQTIADSDMEPIELQLLDRKFMGTGAMTDVPACFLLLRSKSQEDKSKFCMIPASRGWGSGYSIASFGGGSVNLSSFRMIEEYDARYNRRQVGIAALRLVREEEMGMLQNRLFLMNLGWRGSSIDTQTLWDGLNPVDTGVVVGTGDFSLMEMNGAHYAYWVSSTVNEQGDTVYDVNACYINMDTQIASQPFSMLSVVDPKRTSFKNENQLSGVTLLPLVRGSDRLHGMFLSSVYADSGLFSSVSYRWGKFSYAVQIGMEVRTLVPDYPVILPGDTFTSTLRLCNTGMLPIYNFDIDFLATPEGSSSANFVTQLHVDMLNLKNNQIRDAAGTAVKEGESAVYRLDDGTKKSNGELVHLIRYGTHSGYSTDDGQISKRNEENKTLSVLPADGELTLRTSFTAPRDCWGDKTDATLTALVHGLEAGTDLEKTADTATFAGGRSSAVMMTSAQPVARSAANGGDEFEKVTLSPDCVSYAYLDEGGQPTDESDLDLTGNDMTLDTDVVLLSGTPTARITLSNLDGAQSATVIPMLVAMVDGQETWRYALKTELTSDYTRCLTIPLATLAGGKPYSSIDLYLTSSTLRGDVLDFDAFNEIDSYDNHATLYPVYDFSFITEPQSTTAFAGQDVELTAEAAGASGPFTYQWVEVNTDGTVRTLRGETGTTLTLKKVTLAQSNTRYRCIATSSQGIQRASSTATLTVSEELPVTGDTSHAAAWLALLGASGMLLLLLIRKRRPSAPRF